MTSLIFDIDNWATTFYFTIFPVWKICKTFAHWSPSGARFVESGGEDRRLVSPSTDRQELGHPHRQRRHPSVVLGPRKNQEGVELVHPHRQRRHPYVVPGTRKNQEGVKQRGHRKGEDAGNIESLTFPIWRRIICAK